jgi:hypothetical protein
LGILAVEPERHPDRCASSDRLVAIMMII